MNLVRDFQHYAEKTATHRIVQVIKIQKADIIDFAHSTSSVASRETMESLTDSPPRYSYSTDFSVRTYCEPAQMFLSCSHFNVSPFALKVSATTGLFALECELRRAMFLRPRDYVLV